jgi:hypothetical protein
MYNVQVTNICKPIFVTFDRISTWTSMFKLLAKRSQRVCNRVTKATLGFNANQLKVDFQGSNFEFRISVLRYFFEKVDFT